MTISPGDQRMLFEVRRNLTEIGVETRFTARGDRLMGKIALVGERMLRCPADGLLIESVDFSVGGDGMLRIDEPASLRGLTGLPHGAKLASVDALADALRKALDSRFAKLRGEASRLRAFGLEVETDAQSMRLSARIDLEQLGVVVLESDGSRLVARELTGGDASIPFGDVVIDLASFDDRIDLELFLSTEAERLAPQRVPSIVVSGHLATEAPRREAFEKASASRLVPPNVGERWVMAVRVDSDDGAEVRYRGIDASGSTFGAPRVLPKVAFDASYRPFVQGHCMLVEVAAVDAENVGYVRLDSESGPGGPQRKVSLAAFLANFTAETGTA